MDPNVKAIRIPFQREMVRAICTCAKCGSLSIPFPCSECGSRDFRKTETRRVMNPQPNEKQIATIADGNGWTLAVDSPYGLPSRRLVIAEELIRAPNLSSVFNGSHVALYAIDSCVVSRDGKMVEWKWKPRILPSRYMPHWAGRIFVVIGSTVVERIQEITDADALAEGITLDPREGRYNCVVADEQGQRMNESRYLMPSARDKYHALWDELNAKRGFGWDVNPYVWVIGFQRTAKGDSVE